MEKSLEEKVQELWDREQIRSLTYAYGQCLEQMDAEALAELFTEDGAMDFSSVGWGVKQGRQAIKEFYPNTWRQRVKPFFTNHYIVFDDANHAHGWCWLDNRLKDGDKSIIGCGRLHDNYEKVNGKWLFKRRRVEIFFMAPLDQGWAKTMK